jgi:hypothetical protein
VEELGLPHSKIRVIPPLRMGDGAVALFCLRFAMAGLDSHTLAFSLPRCQLAFWPPPGAMLAGWMVQRDFPQFLANFSPITTCFPICSDMFSILSDILVMGRMKCVIRLYDTRPNWKNDIPMHMH